MNDSHLTVLRGNVHPLARAQYDHGAAPADLPMKRMLLVLKRGPEQEAALTELLADQQDKNTPTYHKWLTPEEFGQQFGPADQDIQTVSSWLQSQGFEVTQVSRGRTVIEFSGTASQVQQAFHTTIHSYVVSGVRHWANASDPAIPAALTPVVAGIDTLYNFPRKPFYRLTGVVSRSKATGEITSVQPQFTYPSPGGCGVQKANCYGVGPYDFAKIYNVLPLWTASSPINGMGQTIAIVGETDINPQDVADFRTFFGLPPANLHMIWDGPDPGILSNGEETESDLDVEWSGAVAPYAAIDFVVAQTTEASLGVDLAALNIVDNNLAPVLSESYGYCELFLGAAGNQFYNQLWQQAAAEGITVLISSGDSGSAGCDSHGAPPPAPAQFGLQVSGFASTPYNVAVGGTDFYDWTNASTYWNPTNATTTQASAKSYIPETTWNNTCTNGVFGSLLGFSLNPETNCNNPQLTANFLLTVAGSGGKSSCTSSDGQNVGSCAGGYAKPSWQGALTPADGARDIPDVSLFAAGGSPSGSFYLICQADQIIGASSCNPNDPNTQLLGIGGTSASTPAFAGIMALVNQATASRQGNANYVLYNLAGHQSPSTCNSTSGSGSACVFNDVTNGTIAMPCHAGSPDCTTANSNHGNGILSGYNTGTGYDLATGLGSVNAANLVTNWSAAASTPSVTTMTNLSPTTITHGQPVNVSITVAPQSGTGTPAGAVSLFGSPNNVQFGLDSHNLTNGAATWTTSALPGGTYNVTAHYPGDGLFSPSDSAPINVTVNKENSALSLNLVTFDFFGNLLSRNASTAAYGSPYLLRVNVSGTACSSNSPGQTGCPTGSVSLTDNGASLDAGTYPLNNLGYTEDQAIQLSGGSHAVQASYVGDSSFNAGTATSSFGITPAQTSSQAVTGSQEGTVGVPFTLNEEVTATSLGAAPTGSVTFFADGNPMTGTITYQGVPRCQGQQELVCLYATITTSLATPGSHTITATYNGDANYSSSSSIFTSPFHAYYTTTTTLGASTVNPQPGASVTLTALVDTQTNNLSPTGAVVFQDYNTRANLPGNVALTSVTDSGGNSALQASLAFVPTSNSMRVIASYSGDSNFRQSGAAPLSIAVAGTDFSLLPGGSTLVVSPGQSGEVGIGIDGQASYNGTVNFSSSSCSGLPAETTCSFNPPSVTGSGSTSMFVNTTPPHSSVRSANSRRSHWWPAGVGVLAGLCLAGVPSKRRRSAKLLSLVVVSVLLFLPSCGGGSGSGGGGGGNTDPGTPKGNYTVTVTATAGSLTHTTSFQLTVQ